MNKKVISKDNKGIKNDLSKKDNIFKKMINFIKNHKIIFISILSFVIIFIITLSIINYTSFKDYNEKVVTINKVDYNKSDFAIYLYSAKYNYFGNNVEVTEDDLKVVYDDETKMTVGEYLKEVALSDIKTSASIKSLADKYNITLSDSDYKELDKEKETFIKELGKNKDFKKFLKENNTTEEAYDKMSETDKLYKKVLKNIFGKNKINDLREEEINEEAGNYKFMYLKIKQIILPIIDVKTGKSLSSTAINQKETLAKSIVEEATTGKNFDDLIKKYSEDATDKEPPYDLYYKIGDLLSELESEVLKLKNGEVSKPIKTKYAIHIIQKQELDDSKLEEYYDFLREEKCIEELKEFIDKLQIIYHDAYENLEIK